MRRLEAGLGMGRERVEEAGGRIGDGAGECDGMRKREEKRERVGGGLTDRKTCRMRVIEGWREQLKG